MLHGNFEDVAELEAAKLQLRRREESLAAAQRQRQRDMNLRLLGQFGAVLVGLGILAAMYFL
jgi:hypothetical protein